MRRSERGFALLLLMLSITALLAFALFIHGRLSQIEQKQKSDERRMQALWLARSAATQGRNTSFDVAVAGDDAHVECRKLDGQWVATAQFARFGTATVKMSLDAHGKPIESTERYAGSSPGSDQTDALGPHASRQ